MSRHTLYLDGWQRESKLGLGSRAESVVRQLWADGTEPGGNEGRDAPALWLAPPSYEIQLRQAVAAHIADFLDIDMESVLQAFAESYEGPWQIYRGENDYEPEPPLANA